MEPPKIEEDIGLADNYYLSNEDVLFDKHCDPSKPVKVGFEDIIQASFRIRNGVIRTPCEKSDYLSEITGIDIYFKKDFLQRTGSFKERGVRNTLLLLSEAQKKKGAVAASTGNHALAMAYHGKDLNIPVTLLMPLNAPLMKIQNCKNFGANLLMHGNDICEARVKAMTMSKELGLEYVNGYDRPSVLAGQGTVGLEIVEQVDKLDAIIIPVGGGGLIAGMAKAIKTSFPAVQIIGVESERCPSFTKALEAGAPVNAAVGNTLADGLAVPVVGVNAFVTARDLVDRWVVIEEKFIALAILRLIENEKAVVEGGGAIGLAAILGGYLEDLKGKRVCVTLTGGNIDSTVLGRCIERGLAAEGRLVRFTVTVSDRPGGIADLAALLRNSGASIKDMFHERAWLKSDVFMVDVKCIVETRDRFHAKDLKDALFNAYTQVVWPDDNVIA